MKKFNVKNDIFLKNKDNNLDNYYYSLGILLIFLIFNTFYYGIYKIIYGNESLFLAFRPILNVFISCFTSMLIEYLLYIITKNKKSIDYLFKKGRSSITGFLLAIMLPINTPIYILIVGSIISGIFKFILEYYKKNYINYVALGLFVSSLLLYFNSNYSFDYFINDKAFIIYTILCILSLLFLSKKGLVKYRVIISSFISTFLIFIILFLFNNFNTNYIYEFFLNNYTLFIIVFILGNSMFSPIEDIFQIVSSNIFDIIFILLNYANPSLVYISLSILIFNLFSIFLNYLSIKLYKNSKTKKIILYISYLLVIITGICINYLNL